MDSTGRIAIRSWSVAAGFHLETAAPPRPASDGGGESKMARAGCTDAAPARARRRREDGCERTPGHYSAEGRASSLRAILQGCWPFLETLGTSAAARSAVPHRLRRTRPMLGLRARAAARVEKVEDSLARDEQQTSWEADQLLPRSTPPGAVAAGPRPPLPATAFPSLPPTAR